MVNRVSYTVRLSIKDLAKIDHWFRSMDVEPRTISDLANMTVELFARKIDGVDFDYHTAYDYMSRYSKNHRNKNSMDTIEKRATINLNYENDKKKKVDMDDLKEQAEQEVARLREQGLMK